MSENEENTLEKWVKQVEANRKEIEKLDTQDRLALTASIAKLHLAIAASLQGWAVWLRNPAVMDQLNEKELKETFETFKKLAIDFLDLDLKMSSSVLKKKGKKKGKRKKKGKKTGYIS